MGRKVEGMGGERENGGGVASLALRGWMLLSFAMNTFVIKTVQNFLNR